MIAFQPGQIDKSLIQYSGTMYIDVKTNALVFLYYERLPNELDFNVFEGRRHKVLKDETSIMYEKFKGKYYPAYVVGEHTTLGFWNEWGMTNTNHDDNFTRESSIIFLTKSINTKTKGFVADYQFFHEINPEILNQVDQFEDNKTVFILETEKEKQLDKRHWEAKR